MNFQPKMLLSQTQPYLKSQPLTILVPTLFMQFKWRGKGSSATHSVLTNSEQRAEEMATSMVSTTATAAVSRSAPPQATMVAPFIGLKSTAAFPVTRKSADITTLASNGSRVNCMKVWPTEGLRKFETLSYLPPLSREQLIKQIEYLMKLNLIPCLEFTLGEAFPYRENHRSPGYYDGRYWTMWKLPMFGCTDPLQVIRELDEAASFHPRACVRIIGFDKVRQVQIISFIAHKRPGLVVE